MKRFLLLITMIAFNVAANAQTQGGLLPTLTGGKLWRFLGKGYHFSPATDPATQTQMAGSISPYNATPFVDDATTDAGALCAFPALSSTNYFTCGARTGSAGSGAVAGPGLGCNTWDSSFGLNLQCPITNSYSNGSGGLKSDVTQGCPFIQKEITDGLATNTVFFKRPSTGWGNTPKIHYSGTVPSNNSTAWPGVAMTRLATSEWYFFTFPTSETSVGTIVINNDAAPQTIDLTSVALNNTSYTTFDGSANTQVGGKLSPVKTIVTSKVDFGGGSGTQNMEGISYGIYNNDCNGTRVAGANYPTTTTQVRKVDLKQWTNDKLLSAASSASANGTIVKLPTKSSVNFLDNGVGNGTGIGGDEARIIIRGGSSGPTSTFNITSTFNESASINGGGFSVASKTLIASHTQNNAAFVGNDAGPGGAYQPTSGGTPIDWVAQGGVGYTGSEDILTSTIDQTGATVTVNFSSTATINITRTSGLAGARASIGPGMGGKANLVTEYEIWEAYTPLPVTLTSFDAKVTDSNVSVDWETSYEKNSSHFDIERSIDAVNFVQIGKTKSIGGEKVSTKYQFIDEKPEAGLNYYRLRQVDLDGTYEYSTIKSIKFEDLGGFRFGPNPSNGTVIFRGMSANTSVEIIDMKGRVLLLKNFSEAVSDFNVDTKGFGHGLYIVRFIKNGRINTQKLIID